MILSSKAEGHLNPCVGARMEICDGKTGGSANGGKRNASPPRAARPSESELFI